MADNKTIAILAGDGIGPEVMHQTQRVLDCIAAKYHYHFRYLNAEIGGQAYDQYQSHCPEATLAICRQADAILFGAVGGPPDQQHLAKWQHCEANSILQLRQQFQLSINIRPITVYPELTAYCPLKPERLPAGLDIVIFRELTGGIYFGRHQQQIEHQQRIATDECVYSESQINTIAHAAFKTAQQRRQRLCSVDKANVLATSQLWRDVVTDVSRDYPDVALDHLLVDNCAMQLIINPKQFDVIVTENMFGDILSDLAAALPGSLGLMPSASVNDQQFGLYEPCGGSAPSLAGQGIANPSAQLLSAAMMLRHSFAMHQAANAIEAAVRTTISNGIVTADLSTTADNAVSTATFVDAVIANIARCSSTTR